MNGKDKAVGVTGGLRLDDLGVDAGRPSLPLRYRADGKQVADVLSGSMICMAWSGEKAKMVAEALNLREQVQDVANSAAEGPGVMKSRRGELHYVPANPPMTFPVTPPVTPPVTGRGRKRGK